MVNVLYRPPSMLNRPGPRMLLRIPDWPANASSKSPYWPTGSPGETMMAPGFVKRLGPPFLAMPLLTMLLLVMLTGTGPRTLELELMFQSVAQREPSLTVKGRPEVAR